MRWFGPSDPIPLADIRQTGATDIFTALHEIPYGAEWPQAEIEARRDLIAAAGLRWSVVESVPVHENIKTRTGDFRRYIENYKATLRNLAAAGIRTVIYNFMPALDWIRTDMAHTHADGAEGLLYDPLKLAAFDLFGLARPGAESDFTAEQRAAAATFWDKLGPQGQAAFIRQTLDFFPGLKGQVSLEDLRGMLAPYAKIDAAKLKAHLKLFLEEIVPVAAQVGVNLAIHADDPPFPILGLPRIISTEDDLADLVAMVDSPANGICYCNGSLGARPSNDLPKIARRFASRIHAIHLRTVVHTEGGVFYEGPHLADSAKMAAVVRTLLEETRRRHAAGAPNWQLVFRPDHAHKILDDFRRPEPACPGYPLIGRLRGISELRGLQHGISAMLGAMA
ncbi:hypothetical protein AXK12_03760 [Cephaloticoccus capnophilus]|uniref:Mannonate dehydratase n=2 Tax=Cephaloticoccus capnophilus TaxID=1548208 RepID=A0A139SP93_9BACT|nr:hypothetical protein AXK12_03760 [Cephaloticoccus capnophilus]